MGFNCGIIGLPNVGKSTIFQTLTNTPVEVANYPFCTVQPNVGRVPLSDPRLGRIATLIGSPKIVPTFVEFVDIAGLVRNASQGAGLGNQFLAHIREVTIMAHVLRCFEDERIVHVDNRIDPIADMETVETELSLADLQSVERRIERTQREMRSNNRAMALRAAAEFEVLQALEKALSNGLALSTVGQDDGMSSVIGMLNLLTAKEQLYVCNVDEDSLPEGNHWVEAVRQRVGDAERVVVICGQLEAEIAGLASADERAAFLSAAGLTTSGLQRLSQVAYRMLGLGTFFTAGPKETRAWTFHDGDTALTAAGYIHSDFARGFICAEVFHYDDLSTTEVRVRETGKLRQEGRDYHLRDGDIINFKFNL